MTTKAKPWPLEPLPFDYAWMEGFKPEPVTVELLVHRLRVACETLSEIGLALDDWWDAEGEDQYPIDPKTGYRDLPRYYEQWLMNMAWVRDCERLLEAYRAALVKLREEGS